MLCPHCNKQVNASNLPTLVNAELNAENYGSSGFVFKCPKCDKKFGIYIERIVDISKPYKVDDSKETSY
jgi:hypothetical protein